MPTTVTSVEGTQQKQRKVPIGRVMMERLILLSGAICAGKTAVATALKELSGFHKIGSSDYLRAYGREQLPAESRLELQELGDLLDRETDFLWLVRDVAIPAIEAAPSVANWLLDAVRKPRQVEHFRTHFGPAIRHIHLTAPEDVLMARYATRPDASQTTYEQAIGHSNERTSRSLINAADDVFDTSRMEANEIAAVVMGSWEPKG